MKENQTNNHSRISRLLLQITIAILAFVPVTAGLSGVFAGMGLTDETLFDTALDSHLRYLSGILLAIGLMFWTSIPAIETKSARFQLLTALVFIGGLARLGGVIIHGMPPDGMMFGLFMELIVTPLLCLWQNSVARRTKCAS